MKSRFFLIIFLFMSLASKSQELKLMTYNIRYANENDAENSWSKRKDFITNQLKFYEPDIFGVQEALKKQIDYFLDNLEDYDFVGVGRDDGKEGGEYSAILYKEDQFKVLDHGTFWLSETPSKPSKGWDAAYPRICTYALFKEKETGTKFWYFNTHFDHIGDIARKNSAKLILQKISEMNTDDLPVILSGDFNLEPETEPIQLIKNKLKDSKEQAKIVSFGSEGTFNGYNYDQADRPRIDYIFVNDEVEVEKYGVLTDSKEMRFPSDHFAVMAVLKLE
ncbi:endonuclease/exonuclease/phosphatase [Christiangramia fulva]|uniref:Endonuclease/exonuclease/phosphatase n=1 Tax=Christiangramia fulva TaxID=2126553 RepID=A0A2R3Z140_9FLAO|nr:endonuclease/exonuclease/phosphatase family protein [Christiangramia fulva]AVR43979.1 endonuclease/exonuclease/phosphatase [Christiangramia fulva]